jgi:hypothetical protein
VPERVISPARDEDYYSFEGTAGDWIQIVTIANPEDDPALIDTVITLFDASMTQIAENDDSVPRINTDSEIITRLPATGTYYIQVQEFSTWMMETPEGGSTFTYQINVGRRRVGASRACSCACTANPTMLARSAMSGAQIEAICSRACFP